MIGYGFLALCPITNADSLDYHIGVAIEILNQGKMPVFSGWFHGRLAGSGEVLNALGLAIGAEQFGSLLQFCGLLSIYGILSFYSFAEKFSESDGVWRKIIIIAFLSSPVLVFLVSSPKPQLLQIGMTSFAITLLLEIFSKIKLIK
ncbi:PF07220 domain protein [Leptospira interrogans serovar Copenhageni str. LT2050]|uniref:PF07220 domain protein n=1 Tax=Leptospira interrogans serovar Copenhageni str. LT2050 TaxID=1001598 RepID=M3ING3_LEPIT|nr:PF07220 domain protein [Leptospira interrogans serovar Copenhageni str. LT2050]